MTGRSEQNRAIRIVIDLTAFMPLATGVDTYMRQLLLHLAQCDFNNRYLVCLNFEDRNLFDRQLPTNFSCKWLSARPRIFRLFFQQLILPLLAWAWKADVVHSPAFIMPYIRGRQGHALTIHDMTSFSHPECHNALRRSPIYLGLVRISMHRADQLIVPSAATRSAIMEFMPEIPPDRILLTPLGVSGEFHPPDPTVVEATRERLGLPDRYILFVGTIEPRKNLSVLVESFRRLVQAGEVEEQLVIAGKKGWGCEALMAQLKAPELAGRIHRIGYVEQADLPAVYAGARLFVYPSLLEGFGFPPLEAMACGVPTISTMTSSLTENLQGAAELVPPQDTDALTNAIARLLNDHELSNRRREQGLELAGKYRWGNTARITLDGYQAALARRRAVQA